MNRLFRSAASTWVILGIAWLCFATWCRVRSTSTAHIVSWDRGPLCLAAGVALTGASLLCLLRRRVRADRSLSLTFMLADVLGLLLGGVLLFVLLWLTAQGYTVLHERSNAALFEKPSYGRLLLGSGKSWALEFHAKQPTAGYDAVRIQRGDGSKSLDVSRSRAWGLAASSFDVPITLCMGADHRCGGTPGYYQ
jgi:hypothetical protein